MSYYTIFYSVIAVILTVAICFIVSTLLPDERKYVHARIC